MTFSKIYPLVINYVHISYSNIFTAQNAVLLPPFTWGCPRMFAYAHRWTPVRSLKGLSHIGLQALHSEDSHVHDSLNCPLNQSIC